MIKIQSGFDLAACVSVLGVCMRSAVSDTAAIKGQCSMMMHLAALLSG